MLTYRLIGYADLRIGQTVSWQDGEGDNDTPSLLTVNDICHVVEVDIKMNQFGGLRVSLDKPFRLDSVEPRVDLVCENGGWSAYWYPLKGLFVPVISNGYSKILQQTHEAPVLYLVEETPPSS